MFKILVPVSGGKDSQAVLKLAVDTHGTDAVRGLFCDTQFEHPLTYAHIDKLRELYGVRIETTSGGSVADKVRKYGRFPLGGARFCTDELKIRETRLYLREQVAMRNGAPIEVWYGMRANESPERRTRYRDKLDVELYEPHEVLRKYPKYLGRAGVRFRLPILDWTAAEVKHFVGEDDLNPLYAAGFDRVGCFPCLAAGDATKRAAFTHDEFGRTQHALVLQLEAETGRSVWKSKGNGCAICSI